jgi:hypothetical protein
MVERNKAGDERLRMEIVKVERRKLPASLFEVPAGYRETSMMGMMAQTPEQQKQLEDAQKKMEEAMKDMSPEGPGATSPGPARAPAERRSRASRPYTASVRTR